MSRPPFATRANHSIARSKEGRHLRGFDAVTLRPVGMVLAMALTILVVMTWALASPSSPIYHPQLLLLY